MFSKTPANRLRGVIATALFGVVAVSFTGAAVADSGDAPQVTVKYGDLNLSSPQGTAALYARIKSAAKSVCSQFDGRDLNSHMQFNSCVDKATLGAVVDVNNTALSALYNEKTGKVVPTRLASN
jgi:UrcA family protein